MQPDLIEGQERYRDAIHPTDIFLNRWFEAKKAARIALGKAQLTQKEYYDRNVQEEDISEGNHVLLRDHRAGTGKFEPRWLGPFKVIKVLSNENYLINQKKTNTVVHKNRLKKWLDKDPLQNPALQDPVNNTPTEENVPQDPNIENSVEQQERLDSCEEIRPQQTSTEQTTRSRPTSYNLRTERRKPSRYRD